MLRYSDGTNPQQNGQEANLKGFLREHGVALMIITLFEGQRSETYNNLAAAADGAKKWYSEVGEDAPLWKRSKGTGQ
jgi:hypothetical protein